MEELFVAVLRLCATAGLTSLGRIAIDGTKIGSDAALDANRSVEAVRAEIKAILSEAGVTDAGEDAGALPSSEALPPALRHRNSRLAHLRSALGAAEAEAGARAARAAEAASAALEQAEQGQRLGGRKPSQPAAAAARAEADLRAAQVRAEQHPAQAAPQAAVAEAEARLGQARQAAEAAGAKLVVNTTDPDSRIMKTQAGWVQGYNVQAAVNSDQVVIAYAATQDHNDSRQLCSMIEATTRSAAAAGITEAIGVVLADAGYWSEANATAEGPDRLIATTKDYKQRQAARQLGETAGPAPEGASALDAMEHRLRTPEGAALYATRSHTVEPVFGDAKENQGFRRFMRRGLSAANAEAALIFTSHNLMKVFHHNPGVVFGVT